MFDIILIFALLSNHYHCLAMSKKNLIISTSSELIRVAPENIVFLMAYGNTCCLQTDNDASFYPSDNKSAYNTNNTKDKTDLGNRRLISCQLGTVADEIIKQLGKEGMRLIRIGKSLIINRDYIYYINPQKQRLLLADSKRDLYLLKASKEALKELKEKIEKEETKRTFFHKEPKENEKETQE